MSEQDAAFMALLGEAARAYAQALAAAMGVSYARDRLHRILDDRIHDS